MKDYFGKKNTKPSFRDPETLLKFLSPRGKLLSGERTKLSAQNQRRLAKEVKYARYLALIPYTAYQTDKITRNSGKAA